MLHNLTQKILDFVGGIGYFGVFVLMILESSFLPIPAELVLIPAGALISIGTMSFLWLIVISILGSLVGALMSYALAYYLGRGGVEKLRKNYGTILFLNEKHLEKADRFFKKKGEITVFIGRFVPVVRHLISLPAGFARMNVFKFSIYTIIGAGIWNTILINVGYLIGSIAESSIDRHIELIKVFIILVLIAAFTIYFALRKKKKD